jgi:elongation factor P
MAILEYSEVKERKIILHDGEPYEVISSHVFRKQQRKPVNATKLKNLINGRMVEVSFQSSDKIEEADMSERTAIYLYRTKGEIWFCDEKDKSKRFTISADVVGDKIKYVKENSLVTLHIFTDNDDNEKITGIKLPIKVDLVVTEAPPSIKGNTATGGTKIVTLETGATIAVPLFIEVGEKVRINTETGEYVERAN